MDGSTKVAIAIVVAALLLLGYREFDRQRSIAEAAAVLQGFGDSLDGIAKQESARRAAEVAQRRAAAAEDLHRRALGASQRCVGGVVVQVDGSSYTQVGTIAQPVRCTGAYADRPIR